LNLSSIHLLCHSSSVPGKTKYSTSICSNSLVRNVKFPGVISFLKAFPIWAIPKGSFNLMDCWTFTKLTNIPWAVSGLRYTTEDSSSRGPMKVLNMRLNCLASVSSPPQTGHLSSSRSSALKRRLQLLQSTMGSEKLSTCPEASHTLGCMSMLASSPTMSFLSLTTFCHHASLTFLFISTPKGP